MNKFNIQLSLKDIQITRYVQALKKLNASFHFFSVYSDIDKVGNLPEDMARESYISLAGIKALKISQNSTPGSFVEPHDFDLYGRAFKRSFFYDNQLYFDQKYYSSLNLPLLNQTACFMPLKDNLNTSFDCDHFIKPSSDLKGFIGGILKKGQTLQDFLSTTTMLPDWLEETLLVAPVKEIHSEYRFFVVNGEVLAHSLYKKEEIVTYKGETPSEVLQKAHEYSKMYQPDRVFVMDLALLENGHIEIVEYNCFNGSGVYHADMVEVFKALLDIPLEINPGKKNRL